jgi:hypothetical protein
MTWTLQPGQAKMDMKTLAGQSGYYIWDRTTKTGRLGQVNLDRSA